ncbi:MAG: glutathione peroxidase [Phycisphaeraceae bacterium]|nr:MAG: glutathione peroxidase [Phycisphaeraceae bacterium]
MATSHARTPGPLDFTMNRLDGTPEHLGAYRGRVVLIVNTASRCGLTPQYEGLQRLYEAKHRDGLVVLGFPANDFMGQEPGSNEQIAAFCEENYGVTFPMFEKISVKGAGAHPLFVLLTEATGEPSWNFTKYLIDREGRIVRRFDPRTRPDDPEFVGAVEELLTAV